MGLAAVAAERRGLTIGSAPRALCQKGAHREGDADHKLRLVVLSPSSRNRATESNEQLNRLPRHTSPPEVSRVLFIFRRAHAISERVLLTHVCSGFRVAVIVRSAEVVDV